MTPSEKAILASLTPGEMADILNEAADILAFEGWCQRYIANGEGERCIIGSINAAARRANLSVIRHRLYQAVCEHLGVRLSGNANWDILGAAEWNDAKGRTVDEVIDALRDTAKKILNGDITPKEQ